MPDLTTATDRNISLGGGVKRDAIYLGREPLPDGRGGDRVTYGGPLHHILVGPNGVGKGMRVLAPNLLTMEDKSIVVLDPKGQLATMTASFRRQISDVRIIDPFGVLKELTGKYPAEFEPLIDAGLVKSVGFNPLASLDPKSSTFYDNAAVISDALIKIQGKEPHWTESAQGLVTALIMWERLTAGKKASLENVRFLLTEADRFGEFVGLDGKLHKRKVAGLSVTADKMVKEGGFAISSLAARFASERTNNEMDGVRSTADTQTRWLLSQPMRADLKKNGIDFRLLKTGDRPMTVYIVLPSDRLEDHSIWLRLVVSDALRACMTAGGRRVLFMLDEFAALGHLSIIQKMFSVTRDYRVQLMPILQSLEQISKLYPDRWNSMLGSAGVVQSFRATDMLTAEWFSKRSPPRTLTALGYNEGSGQTQSGMNQNSGLNFNQIEKRTIQPHQMFGMPDDQSISFFMGYANPGLFIMPHLKQMKLQWGRALKNPYYHD